MPESGYYAKRPRPEHRAWLTKYLNGRPNVVGVDLVDDFRLTVRRSDQSEIRVFLTNAYELGEADVLEILAAAPETTCIVSTMEYNHYSSQAKARARSEQVGLFRAKEFLGAVYHDGEKFLDYLSPEQREAEASGRNP